MFSNIVVRSSVANDPFSSALKDRVCISTKGQDDTLFMTMAILLYNRVDSLKIFYKVDDTGRVEDIDKNPEIYSVYWFCGCPDNADDTLKPVKNNFKSIEKLPTHEKFLSDQLKQQIKVRYMPNENTVCFFLDKMTMSAWHCLPFILPKMYPVFKQKPLTKEETLFLESLTYKTSSRYIAAISELANKEEFARFAMAVQLDAFEKKLFEMKVMSAQKNLKIIEEEMEKAMLEYKKANEKRLEAIALVSGLNMMAQQKSESSELQDYLTHSPRISNVKISDSHISFIVKTFLTPHHVDEWDIISKNKRVFEKYIGGYKNIETAGDIKLLLDAIFSENRRLKLKMCAYFDIDYFGSEVNSRSRYDFTSTNAKDYIPNPHLHFHNCFGQNKLVILDQLREGDAIGAIECCISCAQKVNIHETMTFDPFVRSFLTSEAKCLVTDDNQELTPAEALLYLKGNNNE